MTPYCCEVSDDDVLDFFRKYKDITRFDTGTYAEIFQCTDPYSDSKRKETKLVFKVIRAMPESVSLKLRTLSVSCYGATSFDDIVCEATIIK